MTRARVSHTAGAAARRLRPEHDRAAEAEDLCCRRSCGLTAPPHGRCPPAWWRRVTARLPRRRQCRRLLRTRFSRAGASASTSIARLATGLPATAMASIVAHGFPTPPSYHIDRLLAAPTQHFYDVITRGLWGDVFLRRPRRTPMTAGRSRPISARCNCRAARPSPRSPKPRRSCDDRRA